MSWFGFGSTKQDNSNNDNATGVPDLSSNLDTSFDNFVPPDRQSSSNNIIGASQFEKDFLAEQQRAMVQAIVFKLTEISFEKCVPKPSSTLSGSEKACIQAVTTKYLETSQFVVTGMNPLLQVQNR